MNSSQTEDLKAQQKILSDFFKSDTEKIYLGIGRDELAVYEFSNRSIALATGDPNHRVFKYEICQGEHSRHFLYRWLSDTVGGQAYCGSGPWSELAESEPQLMNQLRLLIERDIRPLEVRFMEAVRFIAAKLTPEQRLMLVFIPRTSLQDKVLVDFFQALLRLLPLHCKMLIVQGEQDVLAQRADFCPSNRIIVDGSDQEALMRLKARMIECLQSQDLTSRLIRILAHTNHPTELELLARLTGEAPDRLTQLLNSADMKLLVAQDSKQGLQLAYPQTLHTILREDPSGAPEDAQFIDRQAAEYYRNALQGESPAYTDALHHSLALHRLDDIELLAEQTVATWRLKLQKGAGDICELELGRMLDKTDESHQLRPKLLLTLGEIRESRERYREALDVLDPAVDMLRKTADLQDLQLALELKARCAFALRDTDIAKAAFAEALEVARKLKQDDLTADLLSQFAYLHYSLRQLAEAERLYREALALYQQIARSNESKGRAGEAAQWSNLGHTGYAAGDFSAAEANHRKALEIFEALGNKQAAANQWGYLGHTFFAAQAYEKSIEAYERAAELDEQLGNPHRAAQRYANVGHSMYAQRNPDLARRSFQKALDKYRELGLPEGEAAQLSNLGLVEGDQGEFDQALTYFNQAAELYRQMGDALGEIAQTMRIGHVRRAQKAFDEAIKQYQEALSRYQSLGYALGEGDTGLELGQLYVEKKEWPQAVECFTRAKAIFSKLEHREKEAICLMMLAQTEKSRGQGAAALQAMGQALELYKQAENLLGVANVVAQMGLLHYEQKNYGEAERLYQEALSEFRKKEDAEAEANLLSNLGTLYYQTGRLDTARDTYQQALSLLRRMNHPLGMAGVLLNLSFVFEKEGLYGDAHSHLQDARKIYEQLTMRDEVEKIDQRLKTLDEKAGESLHKMRSELFSGLDADSPTKKKKSGKIGRNDPCPCGSGKKYKKCCGA
jgi:tetratricopeptide (TPR) repeat protein